LWSPRWCRQKNSAIAKAAKKTEVIWLDWKLNLGVEIDYPKPQSIGADRLANAAAVADLYGFPAVVVDFGTAVTFDIVSERRTYIGGVIAPGLETMTNFLYQRTALLPRISLKEPRLRSGNRRPRRCYLAQYSVIVAWFGKLSHESKRSSFPRKKVHVVADRWLRAPDRRALAEIGVVRPHLTLEGLRIIANLNVLLLPGGRRFQFAVFSEGR